MAINTIMKQCFFNNYKKDGVVLHKGLTMDFSVNNLKLANRKGTILGKSNRKPIAKIDNTGEVSFYRSIKDCAKQNYISSSTLRRYISKEGEPAKDGIIYMLEKDYDRKFGDYG